MLGAIVQKAFVASDLTAESFFLGHLGLDVPATNATRVGQVDCGAALCDFHLAKHWARCAPRNGHKL